MKTRLENKNSNNNNNGNDNDNKSKSDDNKNKKKNVEDKEKVVNDLNNLKMARNKLLQFLSTNKKGENMHEYVSGFRSCHTLDDIYITCICILGTYNRSKIMIIGQGEAGKTATRRSIIGECLCVCVCVFEWSLMNTRLIEFVVTVTPILYY